MKTKNAKRITPVHAARFDAIKEGGCIIAHTLMISPEDVPVYCEVHHLTFGDRHGGKRLGHMHTVGLNPWSHRGVLVYGWTAERCTDVFGPSMARDPRKFREAWPAALLLKLQNELIRYGEE